MIRKVFGTILVIGALVITFVLLSNHMLIFPHVTGPITLAVIGVVLLTIKNKADHSTE